MKWLKEDEGKLVELLSSGLTYEGISCVLGRTRRAIKEKANKLGFTANSFNEPLIKECLNCVKNV